MNKPNFLVAIAKNEDYYIKEWVDYHIKLGFDEIVIYEDDWECKYRHKNLRIIKNTFKEQNRQLLVYKDFLDNFQDDYEWVAFFDIDEFLVLNQDTNLRSFLGRYNEYKCILVNWAIFGDNNIKTLDKNNTSVLQRFTRVSSMNFKPNRHTKTIRHYSLDHNIYQQKVHFPSIIDHNVCNTNKQTGDSIDFSTTVCWEVAKLNHYFTKSKEEFAIKVNKNNPWTRNLEEYDFYASNNDVVDTKARDFLYR